MNSKAACLLFGLGLVISLHFLVRSFYEPYSQATSFRDLISHHESNRTQVSHEVYRGQYNSTSSLERKANATIMILARNSDLEDTVRSIQDLEGAFNHRFKYPYVILNEVPFTDEFKLRVSNVISSAVEYGVIPKEHWSQPDWIDEEKASAARKAMENEGVIYGGSVSYRNMCRFNSGYFYRHPLLEKYRWYWRVEPAVHFHCAVDFDPFLFLEDNNKVYGFTITMYEFQRTIETLWKHVQDFTNLHPEFLAQDNAMGFIAPANGGDKYNMCHFWSNFEIADMDFWRGPAYTAFFEYLDKTGGFYYERWGDAPVHSIGVSLFARKDQIHFFDEIGYEHAPATHCPRKRDTWRRGRCSCSQTASYDYNANSCLSQWDQLVGFEPFAD